MAQQDHLEASRIQQLLKQGYISVQQQRPHEHDCVDYDLLFMGHRVSGHRTLESINLEADGALNPIDAALLLGSGPGVASAYWRYHDLARAAQETVTVREPVWD